LLGGLGVHKFILGFGGAGAIMLVVSIVGVITGMCLVLPLLATITMGIIGFTEGIIYLTKSDEDFYETYAARKKSWF
jgi:TM2 domain-containing membrane protein YozV